MKEFKLTKKNFDDHQLQGHDNFQGIKISIENKQGTVRKDPNDEWATPMKHSYGYIKGVIGADGEELDCYVGSDRESEEVFVISQNKKGTNEFDEHKVMLGFKDAEQAKDAYFGQYDEPEKFYGDIEGMLISDFKDKYMSKSLTSTEQSTRPIMASAESFVDSVESLHAVIGGLRAKYKMKTSSVIAESKLMTKQSQEKQHHDLQNAKLKAFEFHKKRVNI